jgi:hypothetical protein
VLEDKWPVLGRHDQAVSWLRIWSDLGRAPRTIDAYARGLAEYLLMCERISVDPVTADRSHIAVYVRELSSRPSRRGANVVSIDSGAGLSNATLQQRLVPVRPFYDFLIDIEILVDRDAVMSGAASAGEAWQHYDLGHCYCSYTFFELCPHQMACAKCDFYIPKDSTRAQLLEALTTNARLWTRAAPPSTNCWPGLRTRPLRKVRHPGRSASRRRPRCYP